VQQAEATRPPVTLGVQLGPRGEQNIEHLGATDADDRGRVKGTDGLIDPRLQLGETIEDLSGSRRVISAEGVFQFLDRVGCWKPGHRYRLRGPGYTLLAIIIGDRKAPCKQLGPFVRPLRSHSHTRAWRSLRRAKARHADAGYCAC